MFIIVSIYKNATKIVIRVQDLKLLIVIHVALRKISSSCQQVTVHHPVQQRPMEILQLEVVKIVLQVAMFARMDQPVLHVQVQSICHRLTICATILVPQEPM